MEIFFSKSHEISQSFRISRVLIGSNSGHMTKLRRLLEISCLRKLLDGMLLKETFSAAKFL